MKLKVKNLQERPYQVRAVDGLVELAAGEEWEGEFIDSEAKALNGNKAFKVTGYVEPKATVASPSGTTGLDTNAAQQTLAEIAALFGDEVKPDEVKAKVESLIAQVAKFDADGEKLSLADAVKSLDDANNDHWTEGGKPDLAVLGKLTGETVKRADVDAIGRTRKTE